MPFRSSTTSYSVIRLMLCWLVLLPQLSAAAEIEDRLAIGDVLTQYSYRWDGKDAAGFVELFTEDVVLERWQDGKLVDGSRIEGKTALLEYAQRSHSGRLADRQTRHHFSGLVFLEQSDTHALTENMALITHQTAGAAPFIRSSGIYRNTWLKTATGWKISKRILFTDSAAVN